MTDVDSEVMRDIDNNSDSQMATALEGVTLDRMTSAEGRSDQNDNAVASGEYLNGNQKGSRSFFRAPGLEGASVFLLLNYFQSVLSALFWRFGSKFQCIRMQNLWFPKHV